MVCQYSPGWKTSLVAHTVAEILPATLSIVWMQRA